MVGTHGISRFDAVLLIAIILPATSAITPAHAAASANLSATLSAHVLEASRNNTLAMEIKNVGKYMTELDVALTIPPPLVLFGDNHWIRSSFLHGDTIRANLTVFAPSSAAGMTLQGSVIAVYKLVGETIPTTETHAISFLVRGWIQMETYEITVDPDPAIPGGQITISGNLLNRGVISAMYANVSLAPGQPLAGDSITPAYVGQVDPNAPAPFTVTAVVETDASPGEYDLTIQVYYSDDLQADHILSVPFRLSVVSEIPNTRTTTRGLTEQLIDITEQLLSDQLLLLALGVVIILIVVGLYLRRRRKSAED